MQRSGAEKCNSNAQAEAVRVPGVRGPGAGADCRVLVLTNATATHKLRLWCGRQTCLSCSMCKTWAEWQADVTRHRMKTFDVESEADHDLTGTAGSKDS